MIYQWKTPLWRVDAQEAGQEIERIAEKRNQLTPGDIVDESRPQTAILHSCFEWDDAEAAERYREQQAQLILRNIVTVNVDNEDLKEHVRAFVSISGEYRPIDVVVKTQVYKDELLQKALAELQSFKRKYSTLSELASIFLAIDDIAV